MTGEGRFLELGELDSDEAMDSLAAVVAKDWTDMGAVRAVFRSWPGNVFWIIAGVVTLALPFLALATPDPDDRLWLAALVVGNCVFWFGLVVAVGLIERHRVCEHGLVVGFKTRSRYVIPWSTLDPGRVRAVGRVNLIGRNRDVPASSPHYRLGFATGTSLALNGLDSAVAGWLHVPGVLEVTEPTTPGSRWRRTPFVWWQLGTRRPERLARAIEEAMVADGFAAHGLAARAMDQATTLRLKPDHNPFPPREVRDPVLGVDGPHLP